MQSIADHKWSLRQMQELITIAEYPLKLRAITGESVYHFLELFTPEQLKIIRPWIDDLNRRTLGLIEKKLDALRKNG